MVLYQFMVFILLTYYPTFIHENHCSRFMDLLTTPDCLIEDFHHGRMALLVLIFYLVLMCKSYYTVYHHRTHYMNLNLFGMGIGFIFLVYILTLIRGIHLFEVALLVLYYFMIRRTPPYLKIARDLERINTFYLLAYIDKKTKEKEKEGEPQQKREKTSTMLEKIGNDLFSVQH